LNQSYNNTTSLVSIVIANYNKGNYIRAALESALRQTFQNIEVIIVDDGSTDQSIEILKSMQRQDNRLKVLFSPHIGKVKAFNLGASMATGDYIKIWCSDDILYATAIEELIANIQDYDAIVHDSAIGDENAKVTQSSFIDFSKELYKISTISDVIQEKSFPSGLYLMKKSLFNKIFPIPEEAAYEDWYITLMLVIKNL
jgi:glycosyltransferase involved in cell wall biosynthesis